MEKREKRYLISFVLLIILLLIIIIIKLYPFGSGSISLKQSGVSMEVPTLSYLTEECCMYSAHFKSPRAKVTLEKELDRIMRSYEKVTCQNQDYYYDKKADIMISDYGVDSGLLMNSFYINFDKGRPTTEECNHVIDPTKLDYRVYERTDGSCALEKMFQYRSSDDQLYDVYHNCIGGLQFLTGAGYFNYFESMLSYSWITMDDVITFLEYQVEHGEATKERELNGEATSYRNKGFTLLACHTKKGNKNIYLGKPDMKVEESYCQ